MNASVLGAPGGGAAAGAGPLTAVAVPQRTPPAGAYALATCSPSDTSASAAGRFGMPSAAVGSTCTSSIRAVPPSWKPVNGAPSLPPVSACDDLASSATDSRSTPMSITGRPGVSCRPSGSRSPTTGSFGRPGTLSGIPIGTSAVGVVASSV